MCVWCTWLEDQYPDALDPNLMDKKVDTFHEDIPPLFAVMEKKNCIFWDIRVIPLTFNHKPTNAMVVAPFLDALAPLDFKLSVSE